MSSDSLPVSWESDVHGPGLRAWRQAQRINQTRVAELAGVHQTAVSSWELGKDVPRVEALQELAENAGYESAPAFLWALEDIVEALEPTGWDHLYPSQKETIRYDGFGGSA